MRRLSNLTALNVLRRASIGMTSASIMTNRSAMCSAPTRPLLSLFATTTVCLQRDFDDDLSFDFTATLQKEADYVSRGSQIEDYVRQWLPPNADEPLRAKLRAHLHSFPLNEMIRNENVQLTHIENEKGEEVNKVPGVLQNEFGKSIEYNLKSALALLPRFEGLYLVQVAENNGKSYCRIRDEKRRFLKTVAAEVEALERALGKTNGNSSNGAQQQVRTRKMRDTVIHSFSDVVDSHFIGWRSKKIVVDLGKAHPTKLIIQKFQNPDNALTKMREMLDAIRDNATEKNIIHHCSGIALSANELSVTLMPVLDVENSKVKAIRHPSDQDWSNAERRMFEATGGRGTYQKSNVLRKQAIGAREFRTDRFGRRIEDK